MTNLATLLRNKNDEPGLAKLREWGETLAAGNCPDHEAWLAGGEFFAVLGQWDRAERFILKSLELSSGLSYLKALTLNRRAWRLAAQSDTQTPEFEHAVKLARQAAELAPDAGFNALAITEYRVGKWNVAIESLQKAMAKRQGGNAVDWFFLAMAYQQLGRKHEARDWYAKAVVWMEKNPPNDKDLIRIRAEAAKLLGLTEPSS